MIRHDALFQSLLSQPDDDTARLVYADWLEEHDDADRADFIRLQCRRAELPFDDPERLDLEYRENLLLRRHDADWRAELPQWAREVVRYERGFPAVVHCGGGNFTLRGTSLLRRYPVRCVHINTRPDFLPDLLLAAGFPLLRGLPLGNVPLRSDGALLLARAGVFDRLEQLSLPDTRLDPVGVAALVESGLFDRLTVLSLSSNRFQESGLKPLLAADLPNLRTLYLADNALGNEGLVQLAGSQVLRPLEHLVVPRNYGNGRGARALADSPHLGHLESLDLADNPVGTEGLAALFASENLPRLRFLDLRSAGSPPVVLPPYGGVHLPSLTSLRLHGLALPAAVALANLARWPFVAQLHTLELSNCGIDADALEALLAGAALPSLLTLDLSANRLEDKGLALLGQFQAVRHLTLTGNRLTDAGVAQLARAPWLAHLTRLDLTSNNLTDAAARALVESPHAGNLLALQLDSNRLTDSGAAALAGGHGLDNLCELSLRHNGLTVHGKHRLLDRFGAAVILE